MSTRKISAMIIAALVAGVVLGTMGIANAVPASAPAATSTMNCPTTGECGQQKSAACPTTGECGQQKSAACPTTGECGQQGAAQGACGSMSGACAVAQ